MERYGTKADLVSEVLEQITDKQEEEKINKRKAQLRLLLKPDADEARTGPSSQHLQSRSKANSDSSLVRKKACLGKK